MFFFSSKNGEGLITIVAKEAHENFILEPQNEINILKLKKNCFEVMKLYFYFLNSIF